MKGQMPRISALVIFCKSDNLQSRWQLNPSTVEKIETLFCKNSDKYFANTLKDILKVGKVAQQVATKSELLGTRMPDVQLDENGLSVHALFCREFKICCNFNMHFLDIFFFCNNFLLLCSIFSIFVQYFSFFFVFLVQNCKYTPKVRHLLWISNYAPEEKCWGHFAPNSDTLLGNNDFRFHEYSSMLN